MEKLARISAALLLLLVWCAPDLIHAAGPGLPRTGQVCAVSSDLQTQEKKKQSPQKPEQQAEEKKKEDPNKKPVPPPTDKKKRPRKRPIPVNKKQVLPAPKGKIVKPDEPSGALIIGASPLDIFSDIETGWKRESVNAILQHFGGGKVSISVGGIGLAEGRFSKSQSFYLLKDLFKYTLTKKFDFVQFRNVDNGQRRAYAVAERYYKRTDDGRLFKDKIYVSLNLEEKRWVINEIKSIK